MSTEDEAKKLSSDSSGDMAVFGEGTPNEARIGIQQIQSNYHDLTGKTEDVSKFYDDPFQIILGDLEQLNHRIIQCTEQYNIKAINCSVKVFYVNDTQETFSSFGRFAGFNAGSVSAVESVLINYNFLILLPKVERTQAYTISVRLASRVSIEKQMRDTMPFEMPKIFRTMGNRTAVVNVKYVDYSVARSLLNTVDLRAQGLPRARVSKYWKFIVRRSHFLPVLARYLVGFAVVMLVYRSLNVFVPENATPTQLASFMLWAFAGIFAAYRVAHHVGASAEDSLDRWSQLSYLSLTAGDRHQIADAESSNTGSILRAALKFIGALCVSVIAKIIVAVIVS